MCGRIRKHGKDMVINHPVKTDNGHIGTWTGFARLESFKKVWEGHVKPDTISADSYVEKGVEFTLQPNCAIRVLVVQQDMFDGKTPAGSIVVVTTPPKTKEQATVHNRAPMIVRKSA